MAVERSLGSEFIFSILIKALASVDLGPESARLPLTLFTTKRCPHRDRKPALCKEQFHFYRNHLLCVSAHLYVLSVLCFYMAYSLAAYQPVHSAISPRTHPSNHPSTLLSVRLSLFIVFFPTHLITCSCLLIQQWLSVRKHAPAHLPVWISLFK
jgi:hypothetical protein